MKEEYGLHLETDEDLCRQDKCMCNSCNFSNDEKNCPLLQKINFFITEIKRTQDAHQRLMDRISQLNKELYN
jgi:hypothetical protein